MWLFHVRFGNRAGTIKQAIGSVSSEEIVPCLVRRHTSSSKNKWYLWRPKVLYVDRAGAPSPLQRGLGKPSWNRFKWELTLDLIWIGRKLQQRNWLGQCVEADDFVVCSRGRVELMFPQFGVVVGEVKDEAAGRGSKLWQKGLGGQWGGVSILSLCQWGPVAELRGLSCELCLPQSRKGLRSTVGEAGCDRKRTPWRLWEWGQGSEEKPGNDLPPGRAAQE